MELLARFIRRVKEMVVEGAVRHEPLALTQIGNNLFCRDIRELAACAIKAEEAIDEKRNRHNERENAAHREPNRTRKVRAPLFFIYA